MSDLPSFLFHWETVRRHRRHARTMGFMMGVNIFVAVVNLGLGWNAFAEGFYLNGAFAFFAALAAATISVPYAYDARRRALERAGQRVVAIGRAR
jgi:hypothetical protein